MSYIVHSDGKVYELLTGAWGDRAIRKNGEWVYIYDCQKVFANADYLDALAESNRVSGKKEMV